MAIKEKCIIWGTGNGYEEILNQINFEIYKGNIEIVAAVCGKDDKYCEYRDGFPIVVKEELKKLEFEYVIISSYVFYEQIKSEAIALEIEADKIINGQIFKRPLFDFALYSRLIKNPVTILSDDCWGGYVYNYLGLKFSSPLINILWDRGEFANFIQEPLYYLQTELTMVREGDLRAGIFPIGKLGAGGKYVQLFFIHNADFNEAKQQWDRRKGRVNANNLFVKMNLSRSDTNKESYIDIFNNCKSKKILFYNGNENIEGKFSTERFVWQEKKRGIGNWEYFNYMRDDSRNAIDILKLLTGEKNYSREMKTEVAIENK
ncbi:MAG: DUF1919 domain-containing protein [Lachnospiraceae bacterium]|nr:DUF1919 domain-containing protein [Lachnospiraceae bacterium]